MTCADLSTLLAFGAVAGLCGVAVGLWIGMAVAGDE